MKILKNIIFLFVVFGVALFNIVVMGLKRMRSDR